MNGLAFAWLLFCVPCNCSRSAQTILAATSLMWLFNLKFKLECEKINQFLSLTSHISSACCYRTFPLLQRVLLARLLAYGVVTHSGSRLPKATNFGFSATRLAQKIKVSNQTFL